MTIAKLGKHEVITATKTMSLHEAAKLMKQNNIGDIVVVNNEIDKKPIGILTDRDIVTKVIADEVDANQVCVGDVMSADLLVLNKQQSINKSLEMMCEKGVRRAPIVDNNNQICGITAVDDLFILIANELACISKLVHKQIIH